MSFFLLVLVSAVLMMGSVFLWSLTMRKRPRWTRARVRELVDRLVRGDVSEIEWLRFLSTPVFHDPAIEQFRRHCLELSLILQPASAGHLLSRESERELHHLLEKFLSQDQMEI